MWGFTSDFGILFANIGIKKNCVKAFCFDITIIITFVEGIYDTHTTLNSTLDVLECEVTTSDWPCTIKS